MFLSTEEFRGKHKMMGLVNATAKLMLPSDSIDEFESFSQLFDEVENDSVIQKLWEAYRKKFSYASDLEWDVIMKAIRRLYALCEKGISL